MTDFSVPNLDQEQIERMLRPFWMDLFKMCAPSASDNPSKEELALSEARSVIFRGTPVEEWPNAIADGFCKAAHGMLSARMPLWPSDRSADTESNQARADRLVNLVARAPVSTDTRLDVVRLWFRSRLFADLPSEYPDPEQIVTAATESLASLLPDDRDLQGHIESQLVISTAEGGERYGAYTEWARSKCALRLQHERFRILLQDAATRLNVDVPSSDEPAADESDGLPSPEAPKQAQTLQILTPPPALTDSELEDRRMNILFDVPAYAAEKDCVFNQRTIGATRRLTDETPQTVLTSALYFASGDLWRAFCTRGDKALLGMAADLALYVYSLNARSHATRQHTDRSDLSNSFHLWMNTQCARKIRTCTMPELLAEAIRLCGIVMIRRNDLWIRQAIIEACAGECRALEKEGDLETRDQFVKENWLDLRDIHDDYVRRVSETRHEPRPEEQLAWEYLSSILPEPDEPPPPQNSIREDRDFQRVINRGATEDVYQFAVSRDEDVVRMLERRLDVRLGLEHVVEPEGIIYDTLNKKGALNPLFADARRIMRDGNYPRAATLFENLSRRLTGKFQKIARDYQAYCLAKQNLQMPAQLPLEDVCQDEYGFASAYWNLACCMLAQDMDQQLEVISRGLQAAPHPRLLNAAVYLSLFLNDDRRRNWLPLLTLTEAVLLHYRLEVEQAELTSQQKRDHILRLAHYALSGEPTMPHPYQEHIPDAEVQRCMNSLLDRNQPAAFEFWLRCREVTAGNQYRHWEVKTEFLERSNRKIDAAKTFQRELTARFKYFAVLASRNDRKRFEILQVTAKRLDRWLSLCMAPDLKQIGFYLYAAGQQFEKQFSPARVLPRSTRVQGFYNPEDQGAATAEERTVTTAAVQDIDIGQMLSKVSLESQARYKDLNDLPSIRPRLNDLLDMLRRAGLRASADAFQKLLQIWEGYNRLNSEADRKKALRTAQAVLSEFARDLERDLNSDVNWDAASPLLASFKRVNTGLARDSEWLPRLAVQPVAGEWIEVDVSHSRPTFPVRIVLVSGDTVRLKGADATIEDGFVSLHVRDRFEDIEVWVSRDQSAVLTVECEDPKRLADSKAVSIMVTFEYSGGDYHTDAVAVEIRHRECPSFPDSPYIHSRALLSDEIEGHFFGREDEQEALLASVRNGQQSIRYIEGIRRAGKSSLLSSIEHEVHKRNLPLVPVILNANVRGLSHAGKLLHNMISSIAEVPAVRAAAVGIPTEEQCCNNMVAVYGQLNRELADRLPNARVLAMMDNFNQLVDAAVEARGKNPELTESIIGFLNTLWASANPRARVLWIFTGHRTLQQYKRELSGADLWGTLRPLPIDFLGIGAVTSILRAPLAGTAIDVLQETVVRVHQLTAGHPELTQKIGELMLQQARSEARWTLCPSDAHEAARHLALFSDDPFANAWYPEAELKREPEKVRLLVDFIRKVQVGKSAELAQIVAPAQITDKHKVAVDDLVGRKILQRIDGLIGVRAYVLDLWLHRMVRDVQFEEAGSPAIFVDIANLTAGKGNDTLTNLQTAAGDGVPGRFALKTVLKAIEDHVHNIIRVPIATKWVVNYPPRCPAVLECSAQDYRIANIPDHLQKKAIMTGRGTDDHILQETVTDVEQQFQNVRHFVLVLGDIDYSVKVGKLLERGKYVHVISRASALGNADTRYSYDTLARKYPDHFSVTRLEDILEKTRSSVASGA